MVAAAVERYGALDVAVNNAGVLGPHGAVLWLASSEASFTGGHDLVIDGAATA